MNISTSSFRISFIFFLLAATTAFGQKADTIKFGGTKGDNYVPQTLTLTVGDTVVFRGTFGVHPLISDEIPAGADTFGTELKPIETGTTFKYVVKVLGKYNYHCLNHGQNDGSGMAGTFTAVEVGVHDNLLSQSITAQNFPNPFTGKTNIQLFLHDQLKGALALYDLSGKKITTIYNGIFPAGKNEFVFDGSDYPIGTYFYKLETSDGNLVKEMQIVR